MKSKRNKKRRANQARSVEHQRIVIERRRSSAAGPQSNTVPRRENVRKAIADQE